MAIPGGEIIKRRRRVRWWALVANQRVRRAIEATIDLGVDQWSGQARIVCAARPSWAVEGQKVEIWGEINGFSSLIFKGTLTNFDWDYFPGRCTLACATPLEILQKDWPGPDLSWTDKDPVEIISDICAAVGLRFQSVYSTITVGQFVPVTLKKGESPSQLISSLLITIGYALFDGPDGVTRCLAFDGNPGATAAWTAQKNIDILRIKRTRGLEGIYNQTIVEGLAVFDVPISSERSAANGYLRNADGSQRYVPWRFQFSGIQTQEVCDSVAERQLARRNRRPESLDMELRGNPIIVPAITLGVDHDRVEVPLGTRVFVAHVTHSLRTGWRTSVRTTGGTLSGYNEQRPFAAFNSDSFFEAEEVLGDPEPIIVVVCDGATSWAPTGTINRYVWSASTGQTQDSADPRFRFSVPASTTSVVVTLTVYTTDNVASEPLPQTIPLGAGETLYEELYYLTEDEFAGTIGEVDWNIQAPASGRTWLCMAQYASAQGQFAGDSAGHVWLTTDRCQTIVDKGAPAGASACTAIWLHEQIPNLVFAAFANRKVYMSSDLGATWTLLGTIPGAATSVKVIQSAPEQSTQLTAAAGGGFYESLDGGASWEELLTGDVAWWAAWGYNRRLACFLNTEDPAKYVGGDVVSFPMLTPEVTHVRGVTLGWRTAYALFVDDQARVFATDDGFLTATQIGNLLDGGNQLMRSGNADGVVYAATDSGPNKSIDDGKTWFLLRSTTSPVIQVAYGTATTNQPLVTGGVLLRAANALWRWTEASGLVNITSNLPIGVNGWSPDIVSIDPTNSNRIAVASSAAWSTTGGTNAPCRYLVGSNTLTTTPIVWLTETGGATWYPAPWTALNASASTGGEGTSENAGYGVGYRSFGSGAGLRDAPNHKMRSMAFSRATPGRLYLTFVYEFSDTTAGVDFDAVFAGQAFGSGAGLTETNYPRQSSQFYGRLWDVACADGEPATNGVIFATSDGVRYIADASSSVATWVNAGSGEQSGSTKYVAFARRSNNQVLSGTAIHLRQTPTASATTLSLGQDGYAPTLTNSTTLWYTASGEVRTYNTASTTVTTRYDNDEFGDVALHATLDGLTVFAASYNDAPGLLVVSQDGGTTWRELSSTGLAWLQLYPL